MEFEWNEKRAASNLKKHGMSFHEAGTVFGDPMAITFHDPGHSEDERRFLTFGCRWQAVTWLWHTPSGVIWCESSVRV